MSLVVRDVTVIDGSHRNGDPFWDGDQTLYEVDVNHGPERGSLFVAVPRGDAFISEHKVGRYVERLDSSLAELQSSARAPAPGRRPEIVLPIEPGPE